MTSEMCGIKGKLDHGVWSGGFCQTAHFVLGWCVKHMFMIETDTFTFSEEEPGLADLPSNA